MKDYQRGPALWPTILLLALFGLGIVATVYMLLDDFAKGAVGWAACDVAAGASWSWRFGSLWREVEDLVRVRRGGFPR